MEVTCIFTMVSSERSLSELFNSEYWSGSVVEMQKGDILGHEFCGLVESMGPGVKGLKKGDRVVASFQIACGECSYCKKKQSSQCKRTNSNKMEYGMYGGNTAGMLAINQV